MPLSMPAAPSYGVQVDEAAACRKLRLVECKWLAALKLASLLLFFTSLVLLAAAPLPAVRHLMQIAMPQIASFPASAQGAGRSAPETTLRFATAVPSLARGRLRGRVWKFLFPLLAKDKNKKEAIRANTQQKPQQVVGWEDFRKLSEQARKLSDEDALHLLLEGKFSKKPRATSVAVEIAPGVVG